MPLFFEIETINFFKILRSEEKLDVNAKLKLLITLDI